MDPSSVFLLLSLQPVQMDSRAVVLRGALGPVVLPVASLPASDRAEWFWHSHTLPAGLRVSALMEVGRIDDAFHLVGGLHQAVLGDIAKPLTAWVVTERERWALGTDDSPVVAMPGTKNPRLLEEAAAALAIVSNGLPLSWPRWSGPLVVMEADAQPDPMPGRTWVARPALPLLRCQSAERGAITAELVRLSLAIAAPPEHGWPAWLKIGMAECLRCRAIGQPKSPRLLRQLRLRAGIDGIRQAFADPSPDTDLSAALAAPLLLPENRQRFADFLDVLRNGTPSEGALRFAYGWEPATLVDAR